MSAAWRPNEAADSQLMADDRRRADRANSSIATPRNRSVVDSVSIAGSFGGTDVSSPKGIPYAICDETRSTSATINPVITFSTGSLSAQDHQQLTVPVVPRTESYSKRRAFRQGLTSRVFRPEKR